MMIAIDETTDIIEKSLKLKVDLLNIQKELEQAAKQKEQELVEIYQQDEGLTDSHYSHSTDLVDTRVSGKTRVVSPKLLSTALPVSERSAEVTRQTRENIVEILNGKDNHFIVVVGPCSIHDPNAAYEYALKVKHWREAYGDSLEIIMRTYVEKPRTELGWKGFVYDPMLDESDDINLGLIASRMLACKITDLSVPIAIERLNALTPQYMNSLVSYDVIGARNTTDQKAREYASASSSPVGFKNTPEGSIEFAAQAIVSASGKHAFLGIDAYGATKQINTKGNPTGHIILRGGTNGPNYSPDHIAQAKELLRSKQLTEALIIDASHGNSGKKAVNQICAIDSVIEQINNGETIIKGIMIESNLVAGAQKISRLENLVYGQSITDDCVDVVETEVMLDSLAATIRHRLSNLK
jgi:3-deoxy-7-phosphoheptulonate synthase